jgi:hypothetical protein
MRLGVARYFRRWVGVGRSIRIEADVMGIGSPFPVRTQRSWSVFPQ